MKRLVIGLGILVAVLSACQPPVNNTNPGPVVRGPGVITHLSATTVKGVYLEAPKASGSHTLARGVVVSSGATLGGILPTGIPTTLSFLDKDGQTVTATVNQAVQLTSDYVLLQYQVGLVTTAAVMKMSTGAVANLDVWPDTWNQIAARNSEAWLESGGTIYRANLDTGDVTELSSSAPVYAWSGYLGQPNVSQGTVSPWSAGAFVYVDNSGCAYVLDCQNSATLRAVAITSDGVVHDIGSDVDSYSLASGCSGTERPWFFVVDPDTNAPYYATAAMEFGYDPVKGMTYETGYRFCLYPITFSPTLGISYDTSTAPLAQAHIADKSEWPVENSLSMSRIGYGLVAPNLLWTNGVGAARVSFSSGTPSISTYLVSGVPNVKQLSGGQPTGRVLNFRYIAGHLWFGPATAQTIGVVTLDRPSTATVLVTGVGTVTGWTVVGGVLFWSDDSGNWMAPVDAQAGTVGTKTEYTGGSVIGVTG